MQKLKTFKSCLSRSASPRAFQQRWQSAFSPFSKEEFPIIFDRNAKKLQRDRARLHPENVHTDYLKDEVAERLVDRLLDIKRRFTKIVDLGSGAGHLVKHLDQDLTEELVQTDVSEGLLHRDTHVEYPVKVSRMAMDEELIPLEPNSEECIMSNLSLHWANDLLGTLCQVNKILKPDGVFIASILGGDTLFELRTALQLAEMERLGGISPHVSPMADARDMGSLMNRAGFNLITVDVDEVVINYPSMFELMDDLRAMGENNAIVARKPMLRRDVIAAASAIYQELYGNENAVPATFQVFYVVSISQTLHKRMIFALPPLADRIHTCARFEVSQHKLILVDWMETPCVSACTCKTRKCNC